jgi:hypothetical protein
MHFIINEIQTTAMKKDYWLYGIMTAIGCIFIYNHFFFNPSAGEARILDQLNDLQQATLSTLNEMTKLLISLSTALFGLIGYFALENYKSLGRIERKYRIDLVLAFGFAALSIDFGYIFMDKWVEQLSHGIFQPYDTLIILPQQFQIITFLLSLFFACRLIYRNLFKPEQEQLK